MLFHVLTALMHEATCPPHTLISSLLPHLPTHGLSSTHLKDRAGFPLIVTEEPIDKDTCHVYRTCHGETRVDEGQGQVWAPLLQRFPGVQQVTHQRTNSEGPNLPTSRESGPYVLEEMRGS